MKIIILGAGQVGGSLAETLCLENHDITLVDNDADRLEIFHDHLDIATVVGFCAYPDVLREAGAADADMLIAVTDNDEANMVACQVAYSLFHTPTKIARIRSPNYFVNQELYGKDNLPIDVFISPEALITRDVEQLILYPGCMQVVDFCDGAAKLVAVKVKEGSVAVGKSTAALSQAIANTSFRVIAIYHDNDAIPITDNTEVRIGDELFILASARDVNTITALMSPEPEKPYKSIMIAGGGNVGARIASALEGTYRVKLIENKRDRCEKLACHLKETTVLLGEASNKDLLLDESIESTDVFISVTNDDEANIISCIQAKRLGARQVMALIARSAYVDLIEGGTITIAISPQASTVSFILSHIHAGDIAAVHTLRRGAAEVVEVIARGDVNTSKVIGKSLSQIKLPKSATLAGVIRDGKLLLAAPELEIAADDHAIIFVQNKDHINALEKLFRVSATFF